MSKTMYCTKCQRNEIEVSEENYNILHGQDGWAYNAYCNDCQYVDDIWNRDRCTRVEDFEVGKYHNFTKIDGRLEHFIIEITKRTPKFVTYKISNLTGFCQEGYNFPTTCRKKIKEHTYTQQNEIAYPSKKDNWSKVPWYYSITVGSLIKINSHIEKQKAIETKEQKIERYKQELIEMVKKDKELKEFVIAEMLKKD